MVFVKHCNVHRDEDLTEDAEKAGLLDDPDYKDQRMLATPTRRGKTASTNQSTAATAGKKSKSSKSSSKGQQDSFLSKFSTFGVMQLVDSIKVKNKSNRI